MKVLIDKNNVVVAKSESIEDTKFGFYIKEADTYYAPHDLQLVETKLNPRVQQDKLVSGKIVANENYKTPEQIEAELSKLKAGR
jgi:hypothetical protein